VARVLSPATAYPSSSTFTGDIRAEICSAENAKDSALYFVAMNVFTTIAFGCTPTGIIVNSEYSLGSSFRGLRF